MKKVASVVLMLWLFHPTTQSYADSLLQIYQQVLQNNPELRGMVAEQDKAVAESAQARSALLPQLALEAAQSRARQEENSPIRTAVQHGAVDFMGSKMPVEFPRQEGGYGKAYGSSGSLELMLSQSLFELPRWYQLSISKQNIYLQNLRYQDAQQQMMLSTVDCYLNTLQALDKLEALGIERAAKSAKSNEVQQMTQVGVLPLTDYYRAKSEYDLSVATEIRQRNVVVSQLEQLRELSGQTPVKLMGFNSKNFKPELPSGSVEGWIKQGEQNNWELRSARMKQQITLRTVRSSQALHLPTLTFRGKLEHQRSNQTGERLRKREVSGRLILTLPLFSGGNTSARVKEAQANAVLASEELEKLQRRVVRKIREAYEGTLEAVSSSRAYNEAVNSAQLELEAMEVSFRVGTVTFVEVMNARAKLFAAKQGLAEAQYSYFSNNLKLKQSTGKLSEEDLRGLEQFFTVTIPTDPKIAQEMAGEKNLVLNKRPDTPSVMG